MKMWIKELKGEQVKMSWEDAIKKRELNPSGDEKEKKELLEYLEDIEGKVFYAKRSLKHDEIRISQRVLVRFEQIKQISEDAIEVLKK